MAIENRNGRLYTTKESANTFLKKLKSVDPEITRKKNEFINHSKKSIKAEKDGSSTILFIDDN